MRSPTLLEILEHSPLLTHLDGRQLIMLSRTASVNRDKIKHYIFRLVKQV